MTVSAPMSHQALEPAPIIGLSVVAHLVYGGADLTPLTDALNARLSADPGDTGALIDASVLLQLTGRREAGLEVQAAALQLNRLYRRRHGDGSGLKILAFMVAGDFMANTPLDFLLEGSDAELNLVYVDASGALPAALPEHDVAFLAIGESEPNRPVLEALAPVIAAWPRPVFNGAPEAIIGLTRDGVSSAFADCAHVVAPATARILRGDLERLGRDEALLSGWLDAGATWPVIVRPIGTHAGGGMEKLDEPAAVAAYLAAQPESAFYLAPFVDYSSPDGQFRKQRIAFIDGRAYASHLAISSHWMVHYLNAGMLESEPKRAEEAEFMAGFDTGFAARHAEAFASLNRRLGLDYFGIDCAELADGRLLLFEADVAMIVHDLDDGERFPYKKPAMRSLFEAFQTALARKAGRMEQAA
jgi:hypothetical protein